MKRRFFALLKSLPTVCLSLLLLSATGSVLPQGKEKLKPEELVAKHLDSIGTADARAALKTMVVVGTVDATFRGKGVNKISGTSLFASEGNKNLFSLLFNNSDYPYEKIGFDGTKVTGADIQPGMRSPLMGFLLGYDAILRQGLLGGTLSTAWPLLNLTEKNPKLEYAGLKKLEGKQVHELRYSPRKGGDVKISLFFEADTFRHVRTEYRKSIAGQMGQGVDAPAGQSSETRYKLVEEFGDFKQEGKLTMPHDYKLTLVIEAPSDSISFEWAVKMTTFTFDKPVSGKEFSVAN